jgi:tellurite resistance protein
LSAIELATIAPYGPAKSSRGRLRCLSLTIEPKICSRRTPPHHARAGSLAQRKCPPLSKEEAFFAILIAAARADGTISPEEAQELTALATRTRTLGAHPPARIAQWHKQINERIERDGLTDLLTAASSAILDRKREEPEIVARRAESVFLHALDIVFTDGFVNQREKEYIVQLARELNIDTKRAELVAAVMEIKNDF